MASNMLQLLEKKVRGIVIMYRLNLSKNDIEKFDVMFHEYGDKFYRLIWGYLKDKQLAEDALQETFLQLARHIDKIEDPYSIAAKNYAYKIAVNIAKKTYLTKKFQESMMEVYDDEHTIIVDELKAREVLASQEINDLLDECIEKLSPQERDIIDLKYGQGWNEIEISNILGIKYEATRQRLSRAIRRLAGLIKQQNEGGSNYGKER